MSPEEMKVAIAEACGWKRITLLDGYQGSSRWFTAPDKSGHVTENGLPDYLNDLNAMAEAERSLEDPEIHREKFRINLNSVCGYGRAWKDSECNPEIVHATAAQRAEAFCRTRYPERFAQPLTQPEDGK